MAARGFHPIERAVCPTCTQPGRPPMPPATEREEQYGRRGPPSAAPAAWSADSMRWEHGMSLGATGQAPGIWISGVRLRFTRWTNGRRRPDGWPAASACRAMHGRRPCGLGKTSAVRAPVPRWRAERQPQLLELLGLDRRGRIEHQVRARRGLRERHHLADVRLVGEQRAQRSMPSAMPPCGGAPYSNASRMPPNFASCASAEWPMERERARQQLARVECAPSRRRAPSR